MAKVPFQTCQLCIEAWKTEVALKRQQPMQVQNTPPPVQHNPQPIAVPVNDVRRPVFFDEGLREIDELLKNEAIDPLDYIRLRKLQLDRITKPRNKGKMTLSLGPDEHANAAKVVPLETGTTSIEAEPKPLEAKTELKKIKVAVIVKSMLGKQVYTSPEGWKLPKTINDKVIKSIFKMTSRKKAEDIRLRAGKFKIACVRHAKDKFAIMVIDVNEEFEAYEKEIEKASGILAEANFWATAVNQIN
jgi:hypothetical protein